MFRYAVFLTLGTTSLWGQSQVNLLHQVADHYNNSDSFFVKGTASMLIPGTSWRASYEFETDGSQPSLLPLNYRGPSMKVISKVGVGFKMVLAVRGATDPKPEASVGLVPFGQFGAITVGLLDAQKVGEETISVQGHAYRCELIDTTYDYSPEFKPHSDIEHKHYAVDPENLIVLRETRRMPDAGEWTGEVTAFSFDQPPSETMRNALQSMASEPHERAGWVGRSVPDLTLEQLGSAPVTLADLHGKFVLFDFWGSYCGPCRRVTQHAQELESRYTAFGLKVVTLTQDSREDAKRWTDFYHVTLPVLLDSDGTAFKAFDVNGVPTAVLADPNGKVMHYWVGFDDLATIDNDLDAVFKAAR